LLLLILNFTPMTQFELDTFCAGWQNGDEKVLLAVFTGPSKLVGAQVFYQFG